MGTLLSSYIFPHPPIIIPEIGRGEERGAANTIEGCQRAAKDIKDNNPDTVVVITPHGPAFRDAVSISVQERLSGSFKNFRYPNVRLELENDLELVETILRQSREQGIMIAELGPKLTARFGIDTELDHGAMVPLYYITKELSNFKIVHVCMGFLSFDELFKFGNTIARAITEVDRAVVVVASGDLSHRLTPDAPCGYNKRGKEFDDLFIGLLNEGKFDSIISLEEDLIEEAGECGLRPFTIMFGCMKDYIVRPEVFSYEGPFGVGYCVAKLEVKGRKA